MRNTHDNRCLQCLGLCAVLLMGSYCVSGGVMAEDSASYLINWLAAAMIAALIWMISSTVLPYSKLQFKNSRSLSSLISLYFIIGSGLYIRGLNTLWRQWSLPQTPLPVLAVASAAVAVYGGSRGVRPVLRLCLPVIVVVSFFFVSDTFLLVPEMSHQRLCLYYGCFDAAFLLKLLGSMILPLPASLLLQEGGAKRLRPFFRGGAAVGLAYLLLSAMRSVLLLGPLTVMESYPLLRSLMLVSLGPALNRMECWGLMALSSAMLTSAMAMSGGALAFAPVKGHGAIKAAALTAAIAAIAFF